MLVVIGMDAAAGDLWYSVALDWSEDVPAQRALVLVLARTGESVELALASFDAQLASEHWLVLLEEETGLDDPVCILLGTRCTASDIALEERLASIDAAGMLVLRAALSGSIDPHRVGPPIFAPELDARTEVEATMSQLRAALERVVAAPIATTAARWRIRLSSLGLAGAFASTPSPQESPITWIPDANDTRRIGFAGIRSELVVRVHAEDPGLVVATIELAGLGRLHVPLGLVGDVWTGILRVPRSAQGALGTHVDTGAPEWHDDFSFLTAVGPEEITRSIAYASSGVRERWHDIAIGRAERDPVRAAILGALR